MTQETSLLDSLRQAGADRLDPVRFRYLESFERRLRAKGLQHGEHWLKLQQAVSDYRTYHAEADSAEPALKPTGGQNPSQLGNLVDTLNRSTEAPEPPPRSVLEQRIFGGEEERPGEGPVIDSPRPLKALARVTTGQEARALQQRILQSIESTPEEAGPMNAHRLVSRALAEMQKLSPEYTLRFARYIDTLLALEKSSRKN
ncbi:DUF2894 domain-containing protein [Marinobacter sp. LQ44]|uniref:DUF2894 domain-containing protein n=1 Tax=unclassified Marinobacter TaxID=83889 RepID=UPI00071902C5|nr:DUF2894 domain-containing protein [Marinobacter sp. LQ44]AMQ88358.1 hypothetical protein ASQ50_06405 [Marinobacter sp. LQ44]